MSERLKNRIEAVRKRIEERHLELREIMDDHFFEGIDRFLVSTGSSDLEKAFFLMLNQFGPENRHYFVVPHERILVQNVYDNSLQAFFEYEIDFAVYSGSKSTPNQDCG